MDTGVRASERVRCEAGGHRACLWLVPNVHLRQDKRVDGPAATTCTEARGAWQAEGCTGLPPIPGPRMMRAPEGA